MHFNMVIIQWILNINQKGKKKKKLGRAFKMVFSHRSLHINTTRASPASWLGGFIQGIYSPHLLLCLLAGVLFTVFSPSFGWFANVINVVNEWGSLLLFKKKKKWYHCSAWESTGYSLPHVFIPYIVIYYNKEHFWNAECADLLSLTEHTHLEMGK